MKFSLTKTVVLFLCTSFVLANSDENEEDSSEYGVVDGDVGTNCTCGVANKEDQRIVGGKEALKNEWPMIAELSIMSMHFCGGTVVTKRHVVTAAHCAYYPQSFDKIPLNIVNVNVGAHEIAGDNAFAGALTYSIEEFITHPKYHYIQKDHDIGVIFLDDEIDFSKTRNVAPACLPLGNEQINGDKLKVLGWGAQEYRSEDAAETLMKVDLRTQEHDTCKKVYSRYNEITNICAYASGKDACQGDSGGPVLWRDPETNRYVLVGVTSYGRNCGIFPAVKANVIHFLPWIQHIIIDTDPSQHTCAKQSN